MRFSKPILKDIFSLSSLTCLQQSVMNFGILMVQGLVNSFGATVMAAFAAAVKIDTFAYLPVQDFGNAYSTFVAQNHGAGDHGRIRSCRAAGGNKISSLRRRVLFRYRLPFAAVWLFPRSAAARNVRCAYGYIAGHARGACVYTFRKNRRNRHMDGNTHRLAAGGRDWFDYNVQKQAFTKAIKAGKL